MLLTCNESAVAYAMIDAQTAAAKSDGAPILGYAENTFD